jgi:hypothetical protein
LYNNHYRRYKFNFPNEIIVETLKWSCATLEFPNQHLIKNTMGNLYYEIEIDGDPEQIWPWLQQLGYHRSGWYIDTWWDEFEQNTFGPTLCQKKCAALINPPQTRYARISEPIYRRHRPRWPTRFR